VESIAYGCVIHPLVDANMADDHQPRVESHTDGQGLAVRKAKDCPLFLETPLQPAGRQHGPLGMILVGHRRTKQCYKPIAKGLCDCTLIVVDLGQSQLGEVLQQGIHGLRTQAFCQRHRIHYGTAQHGHPFAFPFQGASGEGGGRGRMGERSRGQGRGWCSLHAVRRCALRERRHQCLVGRQHEEAGLYTRHEAIATAVERADVALRMSTIPQGLARHCDTAFYGCIPNELVGPQALA
jgi:hypothetical protein